jgi:hypothetical protein
MQRCKRDFLVLVVPLKNKAKALQVFLPQPKNIIRGSRSNALSVTKHQPSQA